VALVSPRPDETFASISSVELVHHDSALSQIQDLPPGHSLRPDLHVTPGLRNILVVEDDPAIRLLLRRELVSAGYNVQESPRGESAAAIALPKQIDVLILNIDLPGACDRISSVRRRSTIPIVAISNRYEERGIVLALKSGADDVIQIPFSVDELLARIGSVLRRQAREIGILSEIVTGDLEIDLIAHRVRSRGTEVKLAPKLFNVLRVLAEYPERVMTHQEILRAVWGKNRLDRISYLRVAIRELRRRIEIDPTRPQYILTERCVGYRLGILDRSSTTDRHVANQQ
jgi:two-component system, OmpR family, KDP operon response regulator KdpE